MGVALQTNQMPAPETPYTPPRTDPKPAPLPTGWLTPGLRRGLSWGPLLLPLLVLLWLIANIAHSYPSNHSGDSILAYQPFFMQWLVVSIPSALFLRTRLAWLALLLTLLGVFGTWLADEWNVWVEYEEWIQRGMPDWGQTIDDRHRLAP